MRPETRQELYDHIGANPFSWTALASFSYYVVALIFGHAGDPQAAWAETHATIFFFMAVGALLSITGRILEALKAHQARQAEQGDRI